MSSYFKIKFANLIPHLFYLQVSNFLFYPSVRISFKIQKGAAYTENVNKQSINQGHIPIPLEGCFGGCGVEIFLKLKIGQNQEP